MEDEIDENLLSPVIIEFPPISHSSVWRNYANDMRMIEILRIIGKSPEWFRDKYYCDKIVRYNGILYLLERILNGDCGPELFSRTIKLIPMRFRNHVVDYYHTIYVKNNEMRFYLGHNNCYSYDIGGLWKKEVMEKYGFKRLTHNSYEISVKGYGYKWWIEWFRRPENKILWLE